MTDKPTLLENVHFPSDLRQLTRAQLKQLAIELRECILQNVSRTGGHLSSNLGTVELTLALHYVFNTPEDRLVWDVGHQSYAHKILTGRRARMPTLRQLGGLSGFPRRAESEYDAFGTAHSSTSISAALGMALAARQGISIFALQKRRHILIQRKLVIARRELLRQRVTLGKRHIFADIAAQCALDKTAQTQA